MNDDFFQICAKSCAQSLMTKQYVSSCPQTKTAWDEAAARKNCSAVKQSCTSPDNFVYHCLANSYQNKLIEVCGVRTPITFRKSFFMYFLSIICVYRMKLVFLGVFKVTCIHLNNHAFRKIKH